MSIEIKVFVERDDIAAGNAGCYLDKALGAIGFTRTGAIASPQMLTPEQVKAFEAARGASKLAPTTLTATEEVAVGDLQRSATTGAALAALGEAEADAQQAEVPQRKRGEPSPGRKRRTREEIAEDEAAEAAEAGQPAISASPENRVGPEDDPEVATQDAADEAAEVEQHRDAEQPLTLEDVRSAMTEYINKYGVAATTEDRPKIFAKALGPVPVGTKNSKGEVVEVWGLTAIPTDQDTLAKCVRYWKAAAEENPFKREPV